MPKLLPCPVCDGSASMRNTWDPDGCYWAHIECDKCGTRSRGNWVTSQMDACPIFYQEVRDAWNARASHDRLSAEVEALRKDAERYQWLRERNALLGDQPIFTAIRVADPDTGRFDYNDLIAGEEMDAAVDQAMARIEEERNAKDA